MYGYIYLTVCSVTDIYYIGKHKWPNPEIAEGFSEEHLKAFKESKGFDLIKIDPNYLGSGKLLWKAIRKYGKSNFYVLDILDITESEEDACEKERFWISLFRKSGKPLYNISEGGNFGDVAKGMSQDQYDRWRSHISATCRERHINRNFGDCKGKNNGMYGKKQKEETKVKIRESLKSINHNPCKGRIWIHNETETKRVKPEDLEYYLSLGFVKGHNKADNWTRTSGLTWVNKDGKNKKAYPETIDKLLSEGYVRGRVVKPRKGNT